MPQDGAFGTADTADLGRTYIHEHVFVFSADVQQNHPGEWGSEDDRVAEAVGKPGVLAAHGVRVIVDRPSSVSGALSRASPCRCPSSTSS